MKTVNDFVVVRPSQIRLIGNTHEIPTEFISFPADFEFIGFL